MTAFLVTSLIIHTIAMSEAIRNGATAEKDAKIAWLIVLSIYALMAGWSAFLLMAR